MAAPLRDELEIEEPVIAAIRMGDRYAFEEFLHRHEGWVRSVIFSVLGRTDAIDDVSQVVWTTVWQRIGELRDLRTWRAWLYRLARNASLDAGREISRRRAKGMALNAESAAALAGNMAADGSDRGGESGEVLAAIQGLPALYREPFVLRHMNDWTYQQISDVMGLPVDTVETRLVRARRMLREVLSSKMGQRDVAS